MRTGFSAAQPFCCLPTAVSTCVALHNVARFDVATFSAAVRTDTVVRYKAVDTVSGDAALYTASASGDAVLLILVLLIGDK